jgi:L-ascorbate metabolism protein UlaG (beta-lactamase superfamily)
MELTWLGRSCFQLITRHQERILFDPYLNLYRERTTTPFPLPDVICVSHGHPDHFADVPDLVRGDSPALVVAIPRRSIVSFPFPGVTTSRCKGCISTPFARRRWRPCSTI